MRIWLDGGSWADIEAAPGFQAFLTVAAWLVPSSLILIGIGGWSEWRDTPFAMWFGVARHDPDQDWAEKARDLDKDGMPDF